MICRNESGWITEERHPLNHSDAWTPYVRLQLRQRTGKIPQNNLVCLLKSGRGRCKRKPKKNHLAAKSRLKSARMIPSRISPTSRWAAAEAPRSTGKRSVSREASSKKSKSPSKSLSDIETAEFRTISNLSCIFARVVPVLTLLNFPLPGSEMSFYLIMRSISVIRVCV